MRLGELNAMEAPEAARALRGCADVERWVAALLVRRPYADRRTLLDTAHLLATWSDAELDHALADHPRIGERGADDAGFQLAQRYVDHSVGRDLVGESDARGSSSHAGHALTSWSNNSRRPG